MSAITTAGPKRVVGVRVPEKSLVGDLRAIKVVWKRELIRFWRDRLRMITSLMQPLLFLFILGTGLGAAMGQAIPGFNFRTFLFPGVVTLSVLFTAFFAAGSIVWDREFGFLREMLVAPVRRWSIVVGKCIGGATVATVQGLVLLAMAGLVGVPYNPLLIILVILEMFLIAFMITAWGTMIASRVKTFQAFMATTQVILLPLFFMSGALFPISNLPSWLSIVIHLNPLTYAVDMVRRTIFAFMELSPEAAEFVQGVTWGTWIVPIWLEAVIVALTGLVMTLCAVRLFRNL
ncbi:MAG: ABC transporter permease [Candidatus Nanopelagicales bacterium]